MDYRHYVTNDIPSGAWSLFGPDFLDYSGNGNHVLGYREGTPSLSGSDGSTVPGTPASGTVLPPSGVRIIANDSAGSLRLGGTGASTVTVTSIVMNPGREREAFSLEAWFKPEGVNTLTTVFGRAGEGDGLTFDGEAITFSTRYSLSGVCAATYYPKVEEQVFYAVGVHEPERNLLYVNGKLVATTAVTDEQASDQYDPATVENALTAGSSGEGSVMVVDGLAVYSRSLPIEVIENHYAEGTRTADPVLTTLLFGGTTFDLVDTRAPVARDFIFDVDSDWEMGVVDNTGIVNDTLTPMLDDAGLTELGTWTYGDILTDIGTIAGSKIEWDVDGTITVETSLDEGVTWLPASNGFGVPGIGTDYDAEGTTLSVRVSFPAGEAQTTRLNSLSVRLYLNMRLISSNASQELVPVGNVTIGSERSPAIARVETAGVKLGGGRVYITPSELPTQTVEGWFRLESLGTDPVMLLGGDATVLWTGTEWLTNLVDLYVDGVLQPMPNLQAGRDYHLAFVLNSPTALDIHIGANDLGTELASLQLSTLSTFPSALTAEQVSSLYNTYLGVPSLPVAEDNSLTITDGATPPKIYSYAWSITSA